MIGISSHRLLKDGVRLKPRDTKAALWGFGREAAEAPGGTRASANTSGSDFTEGFEPGEIADHWIRTERRKPVSSAGTIFSERTPRNRDPAV
jgi:hypothetical protein